MPEDAAPPAKPVRTWGPMILWTAGILLALGLAWFVGAVAVPVWQVRAIIEPYPILGHGSTAAADAHRNGAIEQLGGPDAARRKIVLYLNMPETLAPGHMTAVALLGYCGNGAVPLLLTIYYRSNGTKRRLAAEALANFTDPRVVEPLLELVESTSQGELDIKVIIRQLGDIGDPRALEPLLSLLARRQGDYVILLRCSIVSALGNFRDPRVIRPLLAATHERDVRPTNSVASSARKSLQRIFGPELKELADGLAPNQGSIQVWSLSPEALRDPVNFEILTALVEDRRYSRRFLAAVLLGDTRDPRAFKTLLAVVQGRDEEGWDRCHAALALGQLRDRRAVEPLVACLKDRDGDVRSCAAAALGTIGSDAAMAVPALESALADGEEEVRFEVAEALSRLDPRSTAAVPVLVKALASEKPYYREGAGQSLARIGPRAAAAVPALEKALNDENASVRSAAAEALQKIRGEETPQ